MIDQPFRVLILFETSQQVLRGIARFNSLYGPWDFYHKLPYYRDQLSWAKQLYRMKQFQPDGVIAHIHTEKQAQDLLEHVAVGKPAIISLHSGKIMGGVSAIVTNDEEIAKLAAEHFLDRGLRNFAYCGLGDIRWSVSRQELFLKYLKEKNFSVQIYKFPKIKTVGLWESEQTLVADWIRTLPKPVGILACNDDRGREILEACHLAETLVPEEVAVLGVGNHELICDLYSPTLSSVNADREQAGFEAAKLLDAMMKKETDVLKNIVVKAHSVTTRRSTDIIAIQDKQVAEALMYIRLNFKKLIQVSDVASHITVSRRGLEKRFQKYLNRSIHDEIRRVQINHICHLLRESEMSISQIAFQMGQMEIDSLSRMFRKEMGLSPRAFRKKLKE